MSPADPGFARALPGVRFDIDWSAMKSSTSVRTVDARWCFATLRFKLLHTAMRPADSSWCHLPFWKMRVKLQCKGRTYTFLKDYFRESFPERILRKGPYGDSLWIPAFSQGGWKRGMSYLRLDCGCHRFCARFAGGSRDPSGALRPAVRLDSVTAAEMADARFQRPAGCPNFASQAATVSRMLRETSV